MRFIQSGFKSHETLDLHKRNRHGQTGRGIKRKIRENHDPPFKRRLLNTTTVKILLLLF